MHALSVCPKALQAGSWHCRVTKLHSWILAPLDQLLFHLRHLSATHTTSHYLSSTADGLVWHPNSLNCLLCTWQVMQVASDCLTIIVLDRINHFNSKPPPASNTLSAIDHLILVCYNLISKHSSHSFLNVSHAFLFCNFNTLAIWLGI